VSQENVDLVRSFYADFERGDFSSAEWADPEIERLGVDDLHPGKMTGVAEVAEFMRTLLMDFEDFRLEAEEYRDVDGERLLVLTRVVGRGKLSRVPVSGKGAEVFEIHDGKVTRVIAYWDRDRAFADLGLEE
jgi:ketosteroid isomerase-like protein